MGDRRRFKETAKLVRKQFLNLEGNIADVAGGKGGLRKELSDLGFSNITTYDMRRNVTRCSKGDAQRRKLFLHTEKCKHDLVVALHPDEATDHAILYAVRRRVPAVVIPCCVKPDAIPTHSRDYRKWLDWLKHLGVQGNMQVETRCLKIKGPNIALVFKPR